MTTFIAVDLEATCWNTGPLAAIQRDESEIIEIGAVRVQGPGPWVVYDMETLGLDGKPILTTANAGLGWRIQDEFQTFIKPVRHPVLSPFCKELTTITQEDVDDAPGFSQAWDDFLAWVDDADDPDVLLASWGRYDWNQLRKECWNANTHNPWLDKTRHLNVKEAFTTWRRDHGHGKRRFGVGQALKNLGMTFDGTAHRGIDDARMIAKLFCHIQDPANMSPTAQTVYQTLLDRESITKRDVQDTIAGHPNSWWPSTLNELLRLRLIEVHQGTVRLKT